MSVDGRIASSGDSGVAFGERDSKTGGRSVRWQDNKRYLWMLGLAVPASALLPSQLVYWTGIPLFWWSGVLVFFVIIPIIDLIAGEDGHNPDESASEKLQNDRYYRWCTYLFLPIQFIGLIVSCWMWAYGELGVVDKIGLAVTVGLVAGTGINAAHELGHRIEQHERWLAKIALSQTLYGHFFVEHNRGHHVRVATPEDPASARLGEGVWTFVPRRTVLGLISAWKLEAQRLRRKGRSVASPTNALLHTWLLSAVLFGSLLVVFGWTIAPYLLLQAVVGFVLLEMVNYVEHYALLRETNERGKYVRCAPRHSWNSDRICTNIFLYHLQRHSDHHTHPGKRYQALLTCDDAPQLPAGYASMVMLAAIPPLWRRVMDPRVRAHYQGDLSRANILPRKRDRILARIGPNG